MKKDEIGSFANQMTHDKTVTVLTFKDNKQWFGFFQNDTVNPADEDNNFWNFVHFNKDGIQKKNEKFNGDDLKSITIQKIDD